MATIFKNPNLPDYFIEHPGPESLIADYEAGKVITLPFLKLDIDTDFWASLPVDTYPGLKKLSATDDGGALMRSQLAHAEVPTALAEAIVEQAETILAQVLPVYAKLFEGYRFTQRKIVWRLTTTRSEAMHIDTYKEENRDHFARLFINLDNQPRIWNVSHDMNGLSDMFGHDAAMSIEKDTPNRLHTRIKEMAFGLASEDCFDAQPRQTIFFDPGEAWVVDSRQVAHQIFYGRRAVSIDFFVERDSMQEPTRHYLMRAKKLLRKIKGLPEHKRKKGD